MAEPIVCQAPEQNDLRPAVTGTALLLFALLVGGLGLHRHSLGERVMAVLCGIVGVLLSVVAVAVLIGSRTKQNLRVVVDLDAETFTFEDFRLASVLWTYPVIPRLVCSADDILDVNDVPLLNHGVIVVTRHGGLLLPREISNYEPARRALLNASRATPGGSWIYKPWTWIVGTLLTTGLGLWLIWQLELV